MAKNLIVKVGIKGAKKSVGALKSVGGAVSFVGKASAVTGAGVAALSTKLAGDFQKSLLEISTLMKGTTERDLRMMSKELRAVALPLILFQKQNTILYQQVFLALQNLQKF